MPAKARRAGPNSETSGLARARAAFASQAWAAAFGGYTAADAAGLLEPVDLENFATTAHLLGRFAARGDLSVRAHQAYADCGENECAARCAFWLGFHLTMNGEAAQGSGWLARAKRLLDDTGRDSVVYGYLALPQGFRLASQGESQEGCAELERAIEIGRRFGDPSLVALARQGMGRVLTTMGRAAEGIALLDEVMVSVTAGEVDAFVVGPVYCSVIEACHSVFDLHRAQEWTHALANWFARQPDVVAFRGPCLIHRAEMMQLHGAWPDAMDEARRACEWLSDPPGQRGIGPAFYRCAELHRLRGAYSEAEAAYRAASDAGRQPHPGLALLWLAQGKTEAAVGAIRRLLGERQDLRTRAHVLAAAVDILLAVNDVAAARAACEELSELAGRLGAPYLAAAAAHAMGAVLLAEDQARAALVELHAAWEGWRRLDTPFEGARTRLLIGRAHRVLGDAETAVLEFEAAGRVFRELGAVAPARQEQPHRGSANAHDGSLTHREREVLALVATGKTNRAIADALGISEKTVARHVSNIFLKLDLSSRAAATAYAYQHMLVKRAAT